MEVPFVDLKAQYNSIKKEIGDVIQNVLDTTSFIGGEALTNFEKEFAAFCNKKYAVGVSNGTDALKLALIASGIKQGDEVITVPNTFIATTEAISHVGAKIVFSDIDEKTYTIDPKKVKEKITEKTKAILPVHLYGQPADLDALREIAEEHDLKIVEDCAQAHGAEYKGKNVPSATGCFSFYPAKNLGAYGDAGCVVTDNEQIAERVRMLRDHGRLSKYEHLLGGFNNRLDTLQAAILRVKLKYLERWKEGRRRNAKLYNELLGDIVISPFEADYAKHVYHLYIIRLKERDKLQEYLKQNNISTGIHYPIPLHLQPAYKNFNFGSFLITEKYAEEVLSLPMFPELTEEQIRYVVDKIKEFMKND